MLHDSDFWLFTAYGTSIAAFFFTLVVEVVAAASLGFNGPGAYENAILFGCFVGLTTTLMLFLTAITCLLVALPVVCLAGRLIGIRRVTVGAAVFTGGLTAGLWIMPLVASVGFEQGGEAFFIMAGLIALATLMGQIGAGWAVAARHPAARERGFGAPDVVRFGLRQLFGVTTLAALVFMVPVVFARLKLIPIEGSLYAMGVWVFFQGVFLYVGWKIGQLEKKSRRSSTGGSGA